MKITLTITLEEQDWIILEKALFAHAAHEAMTAIDLGLNNAQVARCDRLYELIHAERAKAKGS